MHQGDLMLNVKWRCGLAFSASVLSSVTMANTVDAPKKVPLTTAHINPLQIASTAIQHPSTRPVAAKSTVTKVNVANRRSATPLTTQKKPSTPSSAHATTKAPPQLSQSSQPHPAIKHTSAAPAAPAPPAAHLQQAEPTVIAPTALTPAIAATTVFTAQNPNQTSAQNLIHGINQRFANVPVKFCPRTANGYGFDVRYPSATSGEAWPVVSKVYGRAYAAGIQENAQLLAINGQAVRTQREFNALIYAGKDAQVVNVLTHIQLTVLQNGQQEDIALNRGDYCLSNLAVETEKNTLRLNQETKGSGYSVTAETTAFVDADFFNGLNEKDRLTLAAVAAGEQYRHALKVKRGRTGMIFGQVFGTLVTFTTGIPITEVTTSSASAIGMKEDGEGALRPAAAYGHYLGLAPSDMHASLEKLAALKESYRAQGKRYDWFVRSDLREFDEAAQEVIALAAKGRRDIMLKPQLFANQKKPQDAAQPEEKNTEFGLESGVGSY